MVEHAYPDSAPAAMRVTLARIAVRLQMMAVRQDRRKSYSHGAARSFPEAIVWQSVSYWRKEDAPCRTPATPR